MMPIKAQSRGVGLTAKDLNEGDVVLIFKEGVNYPGQFLCVLANFVMGTRANSDMDDDSHEASVWEVQLRRLTKNGKYDPKGQLVRATFSILPHDNTGHTFTHIRSMQKIWV